MKVLDSLFARVYDRLAEPVERRGLGRRRAQLLADLGGDVLEIGAGTGRNLGFYPQDVRLTLTEPSPPMLAQLREQVQRRRPDATVVQAPAEVLPFDDASFDAVVATLVLCSVDNLRAAARELRRVLRPDGRLVVIEHVAAPAGPSAAQRVWEPAQKVLGRNCHITRDTRSALRVAGFDTDALLDETLPGAPAALFPTVIGVARPAG